MTAGRRTPLVGLLLACALMAGCRNTRHELLESELRAKEGLYRDALLELRRIEAQNESLHREIGALRHAPGVPVPPPEITATTFGLKRIALGRGTGGHDNDGLPGDEALQLVIEPRDGDDHVVKVPGALHVTAIEVTPQGLKNPLCWWSLEPEQLRPFWKQGLLSTGYAVVLPWTVFPRCETVRIVAQFKLLDGRVFEADRDVKVRVSAHPPVPVLPGPTPLFMPTGSIQRVQLQWSAAPLDDALELGPPLPMTTR